MRLNDFVRTVQMRNVQNDKYMNTPNHNNTK